MNDSSGVAAAGPSRTTHRILAPHFTWRPELEGDHRKAYRGHPAATNRPSPVCAARSTTAVDEWSLSSARLGTTSGSSTPRQERPDRREDLDAAIDEQVVAGLYLDDPPVCGLGGETIPARAHSACASCHWSPARRAPASAPRSPHTCAGTRPMPQRTVCPRHQSDARSGSRRFSRCMTTRRRGHRDWVIWAIYGGSDPLESQR